MHRDSRGFMWLGTVDGLNRYDGYQSIIYPDPSNPKHKAMIGRSTHGNIEEDKNGNIWFCTTNGLHVIDGQNDSIHAYQVLDKKGIKLVTDYYLIALVDSRYAWMIIGTELYIFDVMQKTQKLVLDNYQFQWGSLVHKPGASSYYLIGLRHLTGAGLKMYEFRSGVDFLKSIKLTSEQEFDPNIVRKCRGMCIQSPDSVWIASEGGVLLLNPAQNKLQRFEDHASKLHNNYQDVARLRDGRLVMTTLDKGLFTYDLRNQSLQPLFNSNDSQARNKIGNNLFSLLVDQQGILWIGTLHNGLYYCDLNQVKFSKLPAGPSFQDDDDIIKMVENGSNQCWIAFESGRIAIYDIIAKSFLSTDWLNSALEKYPGKSIKGILFTSDSTGFIAKNGSIVAFDTKAKKLSSIKIDLSNAEIFTLADMHNGQAYLSLSDGKMLFWKYQEEPNSFQTAFHTNNAALIYIELFQDKNSPLFGSASANSLDEFSIDGKGNLKITRRIAMQEFLYQMHMDHKSNTYWFCGERGIFSTKKGTGKLDGPIKLTDLPKGSIRTMEIDKLNQIWFALDGFVYSIDSSKKHLRRFDSGDGLVQDDQIFSNSIYLKNGNLLFASNTGIFQINPMQIHSNPINAIPKIFQIEINDQEIQNIPLNGPKKNYEYDYFQNTLSFSIAAIHFSEPRYNQIRYFLKNYDDHWTYPGGPNAKARYTKLPPGNYELIVQAANSDQLWNKNLSKLSFVINPPFWQTWWFRIAMILIFAFLLAWGIRQYIKRRLWIKDLQLREQSAKLEKNEAVQEERNRIAAEMHDDLGSGLSSMRFLSDNIKGKIQDATLLKSLEKISQHSNTLIEQMGEIIWSFNTRFDSLPSLLSYTRRYALEYLEEYQINCHFSDFSNVPEWSVNGSVRRNLFLVIKECLHNIVKHAKTKDVYIQVTIEHQLLHIVVRDQGIGLKLDGSEFGNGLSNMESRIKKIGGDFQLKSSSLGTTMIIQISEDELNKQHSVEKE